MNTNTQLFVGLTPLIDVDAAHQRLTRRGLEVEPPKMAAYGLRLFSAKDPDGYTVVFQESLSQPLHISNDSTFR
jgi:glyoxylase I family protein